MVNLPIESEVFTYVYPRLREIIPTLCGLDIALGETDTTHYYDITVRKDNNIPYIGRTTITNEGLRKGITITKEALYSHILSMLRIDNY